LALCIAGTTWTTSGRTHNVECRTMPHRVLQTSLSLPSTLFCMKPTGFFAWLLGMGSEPKSTFEAKGNYGEMSGKLGEVNPHLNYKVPFVHQQHINLCGDACALMLQKFWGMATSPSTKIRAAL